MARINRSFFGVTEVFFGFTEIFLGCCLSRRFKLRCVNNRELYGTDGSSDLSVHEIVETAWIRVTRLPVVSSYLSVHVIVETAWIRVT